MNQFSMILRVEYSLHLAPTNEVSLFAIFGHMDATMLEPVGISKQWLF